MIDKLAGDLIEAYNKGFQDGHESGLKDWAAYEADMKTMRGEQKTMVEYDKYIRNVWKAEAVQEIAEILKEQLRNCNRDVKWHNERIEERIAAIKNSDMPAWGEPEDDFMVNSHKKSIEQVKVKIELWDQLLNVIDAELAF